MTVKDFSIPAAVITYGQQDAECCSDNCGWLSTFITKGNTRFQFELMQVKMGFFVCSFMGMGPR
jgi:hypothetical protein